MKAVVDTSVVAYLLLGTDGFVEEARRFMSALDEAWAPALWEAELVNALWMAIRHDVLGTEIDTEKTVQQVQGHIEACQYNFALEKIWRQILDPANQYADRKEPWKLVKTDKEAVNRNSVRVGGYIAEVNERTVRSAAATGRSALAADWSTNARSDRQPQRAGQRSQRTGQRKHQA